MKMEYDTYQNGIVTTALNEGLINTSSEIAEANGQNNNKPPVINQGLLDEFVRYNSWKTIHGFFSDDQSMMNFHCNGCEKYMMSDFENKDIVVCQGCKKLYCLDCDIFIHEILLSCPTCQLLIY